MSIQQRRYRVDDFALAQDPTAEVIADKTIPFSVDGVQYEIDLSDKNARGFYKALRPYTAAARRQPSQRRARSTASRINSRQVRAWAKEQGLDVKDLGRVPADIVAKYQQATAAAA
jgi:hypothetical protein